jgi:4a-hydroxytetrahydrobiopterin dehydratase
MNEAMVAGVAEDVLAPEQAEELFASLDNWQLFGDHLLKRFEFKGFAKAVELANLAAWHSNKMKHHADIAFGWGYCEITYTNHDAGGLTEKDFDCARRFDQLLS